MSQAASVGTGKPYGVERVCKAWERARSTFYDRRERSQKAAQGVTPRRRGPPPPVPDDALLKLVQEDLNASPFRGEGHRKVWARLHFGKGLRVSRKRVLSQGLTSLYGSLAANVARGLQLRMDHGSQYLSDHFINQVRFWGINPNFAFVRQPETNGVAERFNRTLKEQVIHGQIFRNVEEVRQAVAAFVELYNAEWRVEKNGFVSPREARQNWQAALLQEAA